MNNNEQSKQHANQQANQQPVYYLAPQMPVDDDEINLLDYWRILMRFKWLIVFSTVLAASISIAIALQTTPVYRAEATLATVGEEQSSGLAALSGQFGGLASLAGVNLGGGGGKTEEAIATLESRIFSNAFIQEEQLMPILFADMWDAQTKTWLVENEDEIPTELDAYKLFNDIRSITADKTSGMYTLAFEWHDPVMAADWANKIVQRINAHQKQAAIGEAKKSIEYLKNQLMETSVVEMRQAIFRLVEAQTKNIMLANVRDEFVFKVIDPAVVTEKPIKPKKRLMAVLGTMVGFMLGVFLAFFVAFIKKQKELANTEDSNSSNSTNAG